MSNKIVVGEDGTVDFFKLRDSICWYGYLIDVFPIEKKYIIYSYYKIDFTTKKQTNEINYGIIVDGTLTNITYNSLERAMLGCIGYKYDGGLNSRFDSYAASMIGIRT